MEPLRKIFHARCQTNNRKFDLYQVESEDLKVKGLRKKNAPKLILLYLKNIYKIKRFLSYILMIRRQNVLATLMIFINQLKTFMKKFSKEATSKTAPS